MTRPPIGAREEVLLELFFFKKEKGGEKKNRISQMA
jgi:hypothetical protein